MQDAKHCQHFATIPLERSRRFTPQGLGLGGGDAFGGFDYPID
jgi:hypothetical protein